MASLANAANNSLNGQWFYAEKTLAPADIKAMNGAPVLFDTIPNPGANKAIVIKLWGIRVSFNTTSYTGGGATALYYDTSRTQAATATVAATTVNATQSVCNNVLGIQTAVLATNTANKPIYISNASAAFATGDSNITFFAFYSVISYDASFTCNAIDNISGDNSFQVAGLYIPTGGVQTLNGTPLSIVAAPAAGQMIVPDKMISVLEYGGVAYNASTVQLIVHGSATALLTASANFISGTASQHQCTSVPVLTNLSPAVPPGLGLDIKASADPGVSGNSALKIYLTYSTITL